MHCGYEFDKKSLLFNYENPYEFFKCQWQSDYYKVNLLYLIYRWCHAVIFIITFIFSVTHFEKVIPLSQEPVNFHSKWMIYATHWGLLLCLGQALIAVYLTTEQKIREYLIINMRNIYKIYWILHTTATTASFSICLIYWSTIGYEFRTFPTLYATDYMDHALNAILMFVDIFLVSHPTRCIHVYVPFTLAIVYCLFTVVYHLFGGTGRTGNAYIYRRLDWSSPGLTFGYCLLGLIILIIFHTFATILYRIRIGIYHKFYTEAPPS